jgi:hypothetical protein
MERSVIRAVIVTVITGLVGVIAALVNIPR